MIDYATATHQPQRNDDLSLLAKIILIGIAILFFSFAVARGLDRSFENKDRMLCNSAKVSGNEEWLKKCECFYNGAPIRCIQNYDRE